MRASRLNATLTATDMFGETRMAAWRASPSISVRWAALKPVVPMTARAPTRATRRRCSRLASGTENSTSTRSRASAVAASPPTATPRRPTPASSPASRPRAPWPGASSAATRRTSGVSCRQATRRLPMRPAAPATTMSGMATRVPGRLLHEAVRLEHRAQPLAVGLAHPAHRQPELRLEHPGHRHRLLDRDRIRLEEGGAGHREEPVVELARPLPVAVERGVHQLGGLPRQEVRDDRDDAVAADGHEREGDVVVAREHREVGAARGDHLAHLVERARRLLHAGDVLDVARAALERRRLDVDGRAALDVVDEDRDRDGLGDRAEVAGEAVLGRLVVVGVHDERAGRAGPLRVLREVDGLGGRVRARAGHDLDAAPRGLEDDLDDPLVLVVRERGGLAGGPAGDQAVGPVRDVELDQLPELRLVDRAAPERGDHRDERTLEPRAHDIVSPATRSSYVSRRRTIV